MYKTILGLVLIGLLAITGDAFATHLVTKQDCTVEWDPSTALDLDGYILYYDTEPGGGPDGIYMFSKSTVKTITVATCADLVNLHDGNWFIVVTATDLAGNQSGYSNEVHFTVDSTLDTEAPDALTIRIIIDVNVNDNTTP